eukprot:CAMPEP_0202911048 /NCGR_PEP_ID=MMETSP1392-20130828/53886_1 /ASSEMBLY_ACC=CAM_ASM_000868 /TAXON_ID=225041 /ORGANISM="Chlamydomonas chlamydogama, Strain SAG 11-48b" /LENGTH=70 /DNA_ID=CAMNT_0049601417 /DNA_START=93 /DNA_END=305 /DNA_ORIENTATION=+
MQIKESTNQQTLQQPIGKHPRNGQTDRDHDEISLYSSYLIDTTAHKKARSSSPETLTMPLLTSSAASLSK